MKNIKPILIIGIPNLSVAEIELINKQIDSMTELRSEYHVLSHVSKKPDFTFKVFFEKDIVEVQLDELKEILKNLK